MFTMPTEKQNPKQAQKPIVGREFFVACSLLLFSANLLWCLDKGWSLINAHASFLPQAHVSNSRLLGDGSLECQVRKQQQTLQGWASQGVGCAEKVL